MNNHIPEPGDGQPVSPNPQKPFGPIFRETRQSAGYTQRELAKLLDVDFTYISKIENDALEYPPSVNLLLNVAGICDRDPAWFVAQARQMDVNGLLERVRQDALVGEFLFLIAHGWLDTDAIRAVMAQHNADVFEVWAAIAAAQRADGPGEGGA